MSSRPLISGISTIKVVLTTCSQISTSVIHLNEAATNLAVARNLHTSIVQYVSVEATTIDRALNECRTIDDDLSTIDKCHIVHGFQFLLLGLSIKHSQIQINRTTTASEDVTCIVRTVSGCHLHLVGTDLTVANKHMRDTSAFSARDRFSITEREITHVSQVTTTEYRTGDISRITGRRNGLFLACIVEMLARTNLHISITNNICQVTTTKDVANHTDRQDSVTLSVKIRIKSGVLGFTVFMSCTNSTRCHIDVDVRITNQVCIVAATVNDPNSCCRNDIDLRVTIWSR